MKLPASVVYVQADYDYDDDAAIALDAKPRTREEMLRFEIRIDPGGLSPTRPFRFGGQSASAESPRRGGATWLCAWSNSSPSY